MLPCHYSLPHVFFLHTHKNTEAFYVDYSHLCLCSCINQGLSNACYYINQVCISNHVLYMLVCCPFSYASTCDVCGSNVYIYLYLCVQVVAADARLTLVLYALWPWFVLDDPTMEAVLELLCVYTANCTAGLYACVLFCLSVCLCVCAGTVPGPCLPIASVCGQQSD